MRERPLRSACPATSPRSVVGCQMFQRLMPKSLVLARRAVADDPRDPHAHFALGVACMNARRLNEAIAELNETVRLNPSHAFAHANLGQVLNYLDRPDEGLAQVERALRLNPHDPRRFMWLPYLAASHYLSRRYKECLHASEQALSANPGYPHAVRYMVAALGQLGRLVEARPLIPLLRKFDRDFAGLEAVTRSLFLPRAADHLLEGIPPRGVQLIESPIHISPAPSLPGPCDLAPSADALRRRPPMPPSSAAATRRSDHLLSRYLPTGLFAAIRQQLGPDGLVQTWWAHLLCWHPESGEVGDGQVGDPGRAVRRPAFRR